MNKEHGDRAYDDENPIGKDEMDSENLQWIWYLQFKALEMPFFHPCRLQNPCFRSLLHLKTPFSLIISLMPAARKLS